MQNLAKFKELNSYAKEKKILLVNSNDDFLEVLEDKFLGYFLDFKVINIDILDIMTKNEKYDIILFCIDDDKYLDKINQVKLKNNEQYVLICTSSQDINLFKQLIEIGVDKFMPKTKDIDSILLKLLSAMETIEYNLLIKDFCNQDTIKKYKKNIQEKRLKSLQEYVSKLSTLSQENNNTMSSKKLFEHLEKLGIDSALVNQKVENIIAQIEALGIVLGDLITFAQNFELKTDYSDGESAIIEISQRVLEISTLLKEFDILAPIADTFYDMYTFFDTYKVLEQLEPQEVENLATAELLLDDIKNFVRTIFIEKSCNDIFLYVTLFKSNLEQLEANMATEDDVDDNLEFF